MANDIKILIQAIAKGEQETKGLTDAIDSGFKRGKLAVDAFNAATGDGERVVKNLGVGVQDMVKAYLSIAAAKAAFSGMIDILKNGEQAQFAMTSSIEAANREFQNTGSVTFWQNAIADLSRDLVIYSESSLKGAISRTIDMTKRLGLSADQMKILIQRTADLSAGKTDLNGGIERVTSALRGEAEASEYLGLTLNENYVKAWYETHGAHQTAWKDLTDIQKAQIRYQVFLEQTNAIQGRASESAKTFGGALQLVDKAIEDAVTKNQDLAEAMGQVAEFIRDNAASIGELASTLITVTAKVAAFALEWKEVFLAIGAVWGVVRGVTLLTTVINGLSAAMSVLRAAKTAQIMLDIASAANTARIAGLALSTWMSGGLALAATFAATQVWNLVQAYMEMKHWEDVAREASRDRAAVEDAANKKAQELGQRLGMNISSLSDFNSLVKEGKIAWDNQTESWRKATEVSRDQARATELTAEKLKELENTLKDLGSAYEAVRAHIGQYYDFAAQKAQALASSERAGRDAALNIQRQKTAAMLQLIQQEENQKQQIISASGASEKQQSELSKSVAKDIATARINCVKDWEKYLQGALIQALNDEKKYADQVKQLQDHLVDIHARGQDKIRELKRRTMTDEQAYLDKQKQAYETLAKAREAMYTAKTPDDLKKAEELAKKAEDQFGSLAGEVKNGEQVIVSEAKSVADATKGINEAIKLQEEATKRQIDQTKELQEQRKRDIEDYTAELAKVEKKLDDLSKTQINPTMTVQVDTSAADAAIERLKQPTSSTHTIYVQTVEQSQTGGPIGRFAEGGWPRLSGKLPGWGGGDRIRALLEAGEYIIRKEAVAKYGAGLFHALNSMRLNIPKLLSFSIPEVPKLSFATGGSVASASDLGTLRLQAGDTELPVMVPGPNARQMLKTFEKQLEKMRLTRGR